ncbi:MAG: invasion associated locus B family protein [Paracoccaceae bacterium]|nr:invasion associated locus B family protein [Paracoccaceae bacterium]
MTRIVAIISGIVAVVVATSIGASAQTAANRVGENTDWSVFVAENPTECWIVSAPKKTVNTRNGKVVAVNRGDTLLFVTFRPGDKVRGEVSFTGGYPFKQGTFVTIRIDKSSYKMFVDGEWAWPATRDDDAKVTTSMKRGRTAVVTGVSSRGTKTEDTFSLLGFTAALQEAEKRCGG